MSKNLKNNIYVFNLLNKHNRRKRSHGRRRNKVSSSKITLENLYSIFNKEHSGGLHHLLTTLYSIRLSTLYQLYLECESNTTGKKDKCFFRIILDVCCRRLFQPVYVAIIVYLNLDDILSRYIFIIRVKIKLIYTTCYIIN